MSEKYHLLIYSNYRSGNGVSTERAKTEAENVLPHPLVKDIQLAQIGTSVDIKEPTLQVLVTGDGSALRQVVQNPPEVSANIILGGPGVGGEQIVSRHLGTLGLSLLSILDRIHTEGFDHCFQKFSLWQTDSDSSIVWMASRGNFISQMLNLVETHRPQYPKIYLLRLLASFVDFAIHPTHNIIDQGEETIFLTGQFPWLSRFFFVPPENIPSLLHLPAQKDGYILTGFHLILDLFRLSQGHKPTLLHQQTLKAEDTLTICGQSEVTVLDSEVYPLTTDNLSLSRSSSPPILLYHA